MMEPIEDKMAKMMVRLEEAAERKDETIVAPQGEFTERLSGVECAIYNQDLSLFVVLATLYPNPDVISHALSN
jgi:hypothetical protein